MPAFSSRDMALRAIGRNLVNFQKIEHCLKALVRMEHVAGPMSVLGHRVSKRVEKTSQHTLGRAVQEWLRISESNQARGPQTQDLFEPWISVSFSLPIDSERLAAHSEALGALANERNELVHLSLANFNFSSEAKCNELVTFLDQQNQRILEQLAFIAPAIKALSELNRCATDSSLQDELLNAAAAFTSTDEA